VKNGSHLWPHWQQWPNTDQELRLQDGREEILRQAHQAKTRKRVRRHEKESRERQTRYKEGGCQEGQEDTIYTEDNGQKEDCKEIC
jgi:hypothetical protein